MTKILPKKSLGQYWLIDKEASEAIIKVAKLAPYDKVLEIGPGKGALTKKMIRKAAKVVAVEKDESLARILKKQLMAEEGTIVLSEKLEVVTGDILDIDLPKLIKKERLVPYKIIANIPYYITGKLLRILTAVNPSPSFIVLLIQKEVAERVCASAGKMNRLAIAMQLFGEVQVEKTIKRNSFFPPPEVDSAILSIRPHSPSISIQQREKIMRLVRIGFSSPRKTLFNNLLAGLGKFQKNLIRETFSRLGLSFTVRAQELSLEQWKKIARVL